MPVIKWDLVFIIFGWFEIISLSDCYSTHISEDAEPGTVIASVEQSGACTLDQVIAPKFSKTFIETDASARIVFISGSLNCASLSSNPFIVYTVVDCVNSGPVSRHLLTSQYDVHVHGRNCSSKHKIKSQWDLEIISLFKAQNHQFECYEAGTALLRVWDLLPASPTHNNMHCRVTSSSDFYFSEGQLFVSKTLCLKHDTLLELDLHCNQYTGDEREAKVNSISVHWRVGQGSFKQGHLGKLLQQAVQSESGIVSRRKRAVNSSPQFQPPMYQVSVAENKPAGTPVVVLKAVDADEGEAGRLEYFIEALFDSRSNNLFSVDPVNGAVSTVEVLDREQKDTHVFRVNAVDHGTPRRTAMATLTITVSDTNDHDPVFEQQDYKERVRENLEIGYEVLTVRATDGDAPVNGNILYRVLNSNGSNNVFEIDPRSGVIRTKGPVDREMVEAYMLLVEANDQGRDPSPRSATATVHIIVEDDNDNAPQFSEKRYVVQVPEDMAPNTEILQVTATDQDRGSNAMVHFSIMSGNTRGQFYIDAQTGKMDLVSQLDYEANKEYTIRIRAQDGGRPPLSNISGLVTVQVVDINDNAPIFVSTPFQATVLENVPVGYSIIHIQAIDADSGDNSRLEYCLIEASPNLPFSINNSSGWIVVAAGLDRESVDFYNFGVEARDHGHPVMSSSASVSMTILDVNDNNPDFTQRSYFMRLNEDAVVGTSVVTVSAVDQDINSVVTYQISSGNTRNRFSITSQSGGGLITLALPLDYKLERQYVLSVTASDGTRIDTAKVFVNVTDANTHRPVFQSSHYTVNINEDRPVGTTVVVISATDEDTGENARITYFMDDSIPQFDIDSDTGAVTTQMELDYEDQVSYTLAITARDNGIPQKSDTTYLEILVNDVNDNSPRFLRDHYLGSVMEDVPVFTSVVQVSATDRDSGLNGRVFYTFQGGEDGDGDFIIESTSGIVRTLRRLDRENMPFYNLQAFAVDKGVPALKTSVDIQVTILDVNDNPPVFEKDEFDIFVEENSPIGLVVAHVSASDPDEGSNAQIMYQIVEGNIPEVFQLDIFSGELTVLTDLDYETQSEYVIVVQATSAPLVSRATVHVKLVDKNDNVPVLKNFQIIFNNYVTDKSSSFPTGVIGRIPAHDPDASDQLQYSFEAGNELNLVILNQSTGEIRLSQALDNNRPLEASMRISVSGKWCELSCRSGRCAPDVCKNGGTCVNLLVGGFKCECPSGSYEKPYCEMTTRNFPLQSFLTFKGLRQRFHFTLSLSFATKEPNGLLLYNGRFNEKHDFIAVEIVNEQIQLTFSAGETKTTVSPHILGGVSDGQWHVVQVYYYNKPIINQAGMPQGPSDQKVVVVSVDNCDTSVALRFGNVIGNYTCSAQGSQSGSKKSLDLTGPLLLGGVPKLPEDFPIQNRQFVGCMKDLRIDNRHIDMASFIANNGTLPGCSAKRHFCNNNPCMNGGTCVNLWGSFSCDCPLGFGGRNCEKVMANPQRFLGNSLLQWTNLAAVVTVPWHVELMFRTRQPSATLLHVTAGQHHNLTLQLREGSVVMGLQRGEDSTLSRVEEVTVNDGDWHHLQLELKGVPGGAPRHKAVLSFDHGLYTASMEVDNKLKGAKVKTLSVGGITGADGKIHHGFRGCVQGLLVGETSSSSVPLSMSQARRVNMEQGCSVPDPCVSNTCPSNSYCNDDWDSHSCTCLTGYYGDNCIDICALNPCEHQSACTRKASSSRGYTCDCPSNHFGQYCERKTDLPCPRGWWGHKTCGPCDCQTDRGFDADCNKTSGECRCKDNHYRPEASEACLLCECYPVGSFSRACERESGQCQCKPGVIGRQCDRCDNPFAEVSPNGCEVIYDSCPQAIEAGIWWPRTKFGLPTAVSCPKGSIGTAVRHCDEHKGWLPPNLFNCTSVTFTKLKALSEKLARNMSLLDSGRVQQTAAMLANATLHTVEFYGSDVKVAYRLTQSLLKYESHQQGFSLTATQDVLFTENLVRVGSAILAPGTRPHWELIQQTEGGTAALLCQFEQYANTLAQNMRKTYLSPFTIVTPHIVISIDRLQKMNFPGAKLPRYQSLRGLRPQDQETAVTLPDSVFEPPLETKGHRHLDTFPEPFLRNHTSNRKRRHRGPDDPEQEAIASVIIFHSLASLLPESYDPDKRSLRVPKRPVINTPVVSITVHDNEELLQHTLDKPITVQFRMVTAEDRSKPICVFWNHSILAGNGGWSAKGCEMVFRNNTHISCQCYHMTSFAVLMDVSRRENGEILPVKLVTWSTVGVTLVFLFLTTFFLLCLRAMHCNKTSIINNGATALFISELIFILGINLPDNPFMCTIIAILLHFFYLCTFSWLFLEGLHVYRMLSEIRDINYGPMRFYYMIGWGVPAFITGLAVGLDPEGYGNPDFCWLSMYDTLIWSLAGPIAMVVFMNIFLYILASRASCSIRHHSFEKKEPPVSGLRTACGVLLLVTVTCLLAVLSVNSDMIIFHYLFAGFNCLQGPFIFFFRIVFNKDARKAMRYCCSRKRPDHMIKSKPSSYNCTNSYMDGRLYHLPFGDSNVSLNGTLQSGKSQQSYVPFVLRDDGGLNNSQAHIALNEHGSLFHETKEHLDNPNSDSDSDLSLEDDQSGSYASTHSSDSEEEEPYPPEECWESMASNVSKRPHPHDNNLSKLYWPVEYMTTASNSEGLGGADRLKTESLANTELGQTRDTRGMPSERPGDKAGSYGKDNLMLLLPSLPNLNAHPQKGILKKKQLSPIAERNGINRIHNELSKNAPGHASSQGSSSSESRGGRAKPSLPDQLNGVGMSIKAGTVDGDSSGSDSRRNTYEQADGGVCLCRS
ncbi:cadherin EGF LAG seven-pass G-type receptor 2-like isoform X4 [Oncorhynchus keta]|uniref:cadherin EGF LAG seven-pass G-type receptor 2-like isoform X4 n=1 Tax=Oncorhynchus keta TaxID=8018 RepID=UPI00227C0369|nr:cadherin EGF LAG seven-pass G-type receptor 2-like isoform X4 [Oncorhynchus keta]